MFVCYDEKQKGFGPIMCLVSINIILNYDVTFSNIFGHTH